MDTNVPEGAEPFHMTTEVDNGGHKRIIHSSLSMVAISNLYNMACASKIDPRQNVPDHRCIPDLDVRMLRAKLVFEEAMETVTALGITVGVPGNPLPIRMHDSTPGVIYERLWDWECQEDSEDCIIDGCCDLVYVAIGTLMAMGVPDVPHLLKVCKANDAKFPGGHGVPHPTIPGKYGKPHGWKAPDHSTGVVDVCLPELQATIYAALSIQA